MASRTTRESPRIRVVVHIGPIKTGSTAFTRQLVDAQERGLLGASVRYALPLPVLRPSGDTVTITPEHIRYLAPRLEWGRDSGQTLEDDGPENTVFADRARTYLDALAADVRATATTDTTVILVEETLARRTSPGDLTRELLARFDSVDYVLVARAPRHVVASAISQRIKTRAYPTMWDTRASSFLATPALKDQFDYAAIATRWTPREQDATLHIVPFLESDRGSQRLFHRILGAVGLTVNLGEPLRRKINTTPSRFEIRAICTYKKVHARLFADGYPPNSRRLATYRAALTLFARIARMIRSPRWTLSTAELDRVDADYAESVEELRLVLGKDAGSTEWREWFAR